MPIVTFLSKSRPPLTDEAIEGGSLGDLCDSHNAPIPFSCRSANCGTCRIEVLQGAELLLPAEDEELDVLDAFAEAPPNKRLACQAKMRPGNEPLRLRSADEE